MAVRGLVPPPEPSEPGPPTPAARSTAVPSDELVNVAAEWLKARGFLDRFGEALASVLPRLYARAWSDAKAQAEAMIKAAPDEPAKLPGKKKKRKKLARQQNNGHPKGTPPPPPPPATMSPQQLLAFLLATDAGFVAWLTAAMLAAEITLILASLASRVSRLLATATVQGWSAERLAEALEQAFMARWRAQMIAATEAARASNASMLAAYAAAGVKWARWVTRHDGKVCRVCRLNEKQGTIRLGTPFRSGDKAPPAHPHCLPGAALVLIPGQEVTAGYARWYQGEVVVIHTALADQLTITPNHPVATPEGWVPAGSLAVGDSIFRYDPDVQPVTADIPDYHQIPARIGDVVDALREPGQVSPIRVPPAAEQFHGDGGGSDVEVVLAHGLLGRDGDTESGHRETEGDFFSRRASHSLFVHPCPTGEGFIAPSRAPDGVMSGGGKPLAVAGGRASHADVHRGTSVAGFDSVLGEEPAQRVPADPELTGDCVDALTAGVAADHVVRVERFPFSGHVYNLETTGGWFVADNIVVHNCRCYLRPSNRLMRLIGKRAGPLPGARPVPSAEVHAQMSANFPDKALDWIHEMEWVKAHVPQDLVDYDDVKSWNAYHEPNRVGEFEDEIRSGGRPGHRVVMVDEPSAAKIVVVDGHHHTLAYRNLGLPVRAYVGEASHDNGPWLEAHAYQEKDNEPGGSGYQPHDDPARKDEAIPQDWVDAAVEQWRGWELPGAVMAMIAEDLGKGLSEDQVVGIAVGMLKSGATPYLSAHHAPIGHEGVWHSKHPPMQLPAYIQNIRNALMRGGMGEREAHAMAVAAVERWAKGNLRWGPHRKVTPEVQAASARAVAEWEDLRRNHP